MTLRRLALCLSLVALLSAHSVPALAVGPWNLKDPRCVLVLTPKLGAELAAALNGLQANQNLELVLGTASGDGAYVAVRDVVAAAQGLGFPAADVRGDVTQADPVSGAVFLTLHGPLSPNVLNSLFAVMAMDEVHSTRLIGVAAAAPAETPQQVVVRLRGYEGALRQYVVDELGEGDSRIAQYQNLFVDNARSAAIAVLTRVIQARAGQSVTALNVTVVTGRDRSSDYVPMSMSVSRRFRVRATFSGGETVVSTVDFDIMGNMQENPRFDRVEAATVTSPFAAPTMIVNPFGAPAPSPALTASELLQSVNTYLQKQWSHMPEEHSGIRAMIASTIADAAFRRDPAAYMAAWHQRRGREENLIMPEDAAMEYFDAHRSQLPALALVDKASLWALNPNLAPPLSGDLQLALACVEHGDVAILELTVQQSADAHDMDVELADLMVLGDASVTNIGRFPTESMPARGTRRVILKGQDQANAFRAFLRKGYKSVVSVEVVSVPVAAHNPNE